jgi:hypothetical protein
MESVTIQSRQSRKYYRMGSIVLRQVIGFGRIFEQPLAIVWVHSDDERVWLGGGMSGESGHEAAGCLENLRAVVSGNRLHVRELEPHHPDCFERAQR